MAGPQSRGDKSRNGGRRLIRDGEDRADVDLAGHIGVVAVGGGAITAAVVGVILNLSIWFALHVLFAEVRQVRAYGMEIDVPVLSTVNVAALLLTVAAMIAVFRFKVGMIRKGRPGPTFRDGA